MAIHSGLTARFTGSARLQIYDEWKSTMFDVTAYVPNARTTWWETTLQGFPIEIVRRYVFQKIITVPTYISY